MEHILSIREVDAGSYEVAIDEGDRSTHLVRVDPAYADELGYGNAVEDLLRRSFQFLLAREPKEAILREFDLRDIQRYFPEYPDVIRS